LSSKLTLLKRGKVELNFGARALYLKNVRAMQTTFNRPFSGSLIELCSWNKSGT